MPVDFDALPPRVTVPDARVSAVPWMIALVVIVAAWVAWSIATWPSGRPTRTLWFWFQTFALPSLVWLGLYAGLRFFRINRRRNAQANNAAIDRKEDILHGDASVPLIVSAQSWCISADPKSNRLEDAVEPRSTNDDTSEAGILAIPGKVFYQGNRVDEVLRHTHILEWLLVKLITPFVTSLRTGINPDAISVRLCLESVLTPNEARQCIVTAWAKLGLRRPEKVQLVDEMSLFAFAQWLDERACTSMNLAIAVQLRGAVSGGLEVGQAEAGAALLLTTEPSSAADLTNTIYVHRPSRVQADMISDGIANALRWGRCGDSKIGTLWNTGLSESLATLFKGLASPVSEAPAVELTQTIGDAGVALPWLAVALAAQSAKEKTGPQLILGQQNGELVAMICRKKI